jgi:hypothetical protein
MLLQCSIEFYHLEFSYLQLAENDFSFMELSRGWHRHAPCR